jgi:hypothetical protein
MGNDMIENQYVPLCDNGMVMVMVRQRLDNFESILVCEAR